MKGAVELQRKIYEGGIVACETEMEVKMSMNHYMPTRLITGKGCVKKSLEEWKRMGDRLLIVTGRNSARACGALEDVEEALKANGQKWTLYDKIGQNPKLEDCMEAAKMATEWGAEGVVGIGGGSPLDAAKCIAVLAANPGMTREQLYGLAWKNSPLKIAAVGTTAGTGSEVTKVSVITTDGRKKSFHHDGIYPLLAFGDAGYTMTLPEQFTRSTAVDAMAHCVESYFSKAADGLSRNFAVAGICLLLEVFKKIQKSGCAAMTYEDREKCYEASIYGGLAINKTGTCFPHTMGYLLTEEYGIPHGTACAVFLPEFYAYNQMAAPGLAEKFLQDIHAGKEEWISLVESMTPECRVSIPEEKIAKAHGRWENNNSIMKCQGEMTADMADDILRRILR